MPRRALYTDPDTIRLVTDLDKRGHGRDAIAERMGVSKQTVRKILDPDYAEAERRRLADVDKARMPVRLKDPGYLAYQAAYNDSDAHRARSRASMARHRGKDTAAPSDEGTWAEAAPRVRAQIERVSAEERRRAETARTRTTAELSLEGSIAANRLMRDGGCSWSELIDRLLIDALARGWTPKS